MAVERMNLTFNSQMHDTPILHNIGRQYALAVNIERANISDAAGWVQITLTGESEEIQRAVAYLHTLGVFVSPTELAVVS